MTFIALDGVSSQIKNSSSILTNPHLPNGIVATGYEGLRLLIEIQNGMYDVCSWHYGSIFEAGIKAPGVLCNEFQHSSYILTCGTTSNGIISTITILLATSENLAVRVECEIGLINPTIETVAALNLTVTGEMCFV